MTVSLREYTWMALDAYDSRSRTNDPESPARADPAVEAEFPEWRVVEGTGDAVPRNATVTESNGFEANIYVNDSANEVVVALRGTEFTQFLDELDDGDFDVIDEANLDRDIETLFGYYQDGGETIATFIDEGGGLDNFLEDTVGLSQTQADLVAGALAILSGNPFNDPVEELAEDGEGTLREQAEAAIRTVLQAAADNPGKTVTVTGHSLGGALAGYVAAALGVPAFAFDPAPYGAQAFLDELRAFAEATIAADFPGLDTAAAGWTITGSPAQTAADLVQTQRLEGSFVPELYLTASPLDLPEGEGTDRVIGPLGEDINAFTLHSPDLLALVLDSEIRATETRPDIQTLAADLPSLIRQTDNGGLVSPQDESSSTFYRTLLVEETLYESFAALIGWVDDRSEGLAPEGAGLERDRSLEERLIDDALAALGETVGAEEFDAPPTVEAVFEDALIGAYGAAETFTPDAGQDLIVTGAGAPDTIIATIATIEDDLIVDFDGADRIIMTDAVFDTSAISLTPNSDDRTLISIDLTGDGGPNSRYNFSGSLSDGDLVATNDGSQTTITLAGGPGVVIGQEEAEVVALLYEAGLGRQADDAGLNFWIDQREAGFTEYALSSEFLASDEFESTVGDPDTLTDQELVEGLYENVLGRPGEEEGIAFWTEVLAGPAFAAENTLLAFAVSEENRATATELETLAEIEPGTWSFG
ncbi:MAG: DUF4214 domain-containing protein [Pseudomonadota bacterium]